MMINPKDDSLLFVSLLFVIFSSLEWLKGLLFSLFCVSSDMFIIQILIQSDHIQTVRTLHIVVWGIQYAWVRKDVYVHVYSN